MKLKKILASLRPLAAVAAPFIPGGPAILAAVNAVLPPDKRLPDTATGGEILSAVDALPADQRAALMEREIDLQIEQERGWTERYKAMAEADGQSTRPRIALMMAWLFVFETVAFAGLLGWGVYQGGIEALNQPYLWTVFASLTALPAGLLGKYFGELRREQQNRLGMQKPGPLAGLLGVLRR